MQKRSIVDQIEITRDGTLQVRIAKEIVDEDGEIVAQAWHRTVFSPGDDIDTQVANFNAHLVSMKEVAIEPNCVDRIKAVAQVAWTSVSG